MAAYVISFICKAGSCSCSRLKQNKVALSSRVVRQEIHPSTLCDPLACRSSSVRELRPTSSSTRLLNTSSSSASQASDGNHMDRHGKEAGLTQESHGGHHLLTPSGIAAELK